MQNHELEYGFYMFSKNFLDKHEKIVELLTCIFVLTLLL